MAKGKKGKTGGQNAPSYQGMAAQQGAAAPMGQRGNSPWGQMRGQMMGQGGPDQNAWLQRRRMGGQMPNQGDPAAAQAKFSQAVGNFNPQQMEQFTSSPQFQQALALRMGQNPALGMQ